MAKGFIRGTLWGAGVSFGAVTLLSLMGGEPQQAPVPRSAAALADQAAAPGSNRGKEGVGPTAAGLATEEVPAPQPDTLAALLSDALSPAAVPQTGGASALSQAASPEETGLSGIAVPDTRAPSVRYSGNGALQVPATEPTLPISTEPAQPPQPQAIPQATAFVEPQTPETPDIPAVPSEGQAVAMPEEAEQPLQETFEVTAIAINPEQPTLPTESAPFSAFEEEALPEAEQPDPVKPAVADAPVDALPAENEKPATDTQTEVAVVEAPLAPAPEVAQEAVQPEQIAIPTGSSVVASIATAEPSAPQVSDVADLPEPESQETTGDQGDSTDAQVTAEIAVTVPQSAPDPDQGPAVSVDASQAPDLPERTALHALARIETILAPDVQKTADRIVETQAQATPKAQEREAAPVANVRINRLPTLGGGDTPETTAPVEDPPQTVPATEPEAAGSPLERYRVAFEAPEGKPLMAVILMDEGVDLSDNAVGLEAIKALPYPVSFAVNALLPDAAERMAAYRSAGFEVLAGIDLPAGATAADAEVNLSVALEKLPQIIGIFEGTSTGVQTTPTAGRQVAQILAQTGHGFVTQNRGLNTVQKLAAREGVPARVVFRDLDGKGQSEVVIRRFMDQAAFRAGQDGGVIMLGRLRAETLAALLSWSLQDRSGTVAMAPVSAVLTQ